MHKIISKWFGKPSVKGGFMSKTNVLGKLPPNNVPKRLVEKPKYSMLEYKEARFSKGKGWNEMSKEEKIEFADKVGWKGREAVAKEGREAAAKDLKLKTYKDDDGLYDEDSGMYI